jgi:hypothetical protein
MIKRKRYLAKQLVSFRKLAFPCNNIHHRMLNRVVVFALLLTFLLLEEKALAQDANAGINEATNRVKSYFSSGTNLMYAVGALLGLIGAVKVYQKWNSGDPDTGKVAAAWFGSCIFLVVVSTVIKSFFGV